MREGNSAEGAYPAVGNIEISASAQVSMVRPVEANKTMPRRRYDDPTEPTTVDTVT
jgi:hypothetical protein